MASRSQKIIDIAPPLPTDLEAERTILGAIMVNNKYIDEAAVLKELDFSCESHQLIFKAMNEMFESGEVIDSVTLPAKLRSMRFLEQVGGAAYVAKLPIGLPRITNVAHYASIIRRQSMNRQIIQITSLSQQLAFEAAGLPEENADQVIKQMMDLATEYAVEKLRGKTRTESRVSLMQGLETKDNLLRIYTGLTKLDEATGGFRVEELITITASATGSGKTLLAQQIKALACQSGRHGLYFSGEMPSEDLEAREIAVDAGVPHWKLRRPECLNEEEYAALVNATGVCKHCRNIDGDFSIRDIRIASRRMKATGQLSWIVIDYDELVDAPGKDEFAQQRNVIREAKRLAVNLEVPVFMISGIRKTNDKGQSKSPKIESVYGSGAKSKHSTYVLYVDRPFVRDLKSDQAKATIYILKSRNGKMGKIKALFNTGTLRFENLPDGNEPSDDDF